MSLMSLLLLKPFFLPFRSDVETFEYHQPGWFYPSVPHKRLFCCLYISRHYRRRQRAITSHFCPFCPAWHCSPASLHCAHLHVLPAIAASGNKVNNGGTSGAEIRDQGSFVFPSFDNFPPTSQKIFLGVCFSLLSWTYLDLCTQSKSSWYCRKY